MFMIRSVVLFTHVVAMIALLAGLALEWLGLNGLQRSVTRLEGMTWVRLTLAVQRVFGAALGITVLSGFNLGGRVGMLGAGWMIASYGALLLIGLSGGLLARSLIRALRQAVRDPSDRTFAAVQASASRKLPRVSLHVRMALALGIAYLMIDKPDIGVSLAIIAIALVFALLVSLQKRPAQSTFAAGYR
jgi:hypothetical protein